MTAPRWPAGAAAARAEARAGGGDGALAARDATPGSAPVVVLTYPHGGSPRLRALLAERPELACTTGTGLLPACEHAASAWRKVERRRDGGMSALAAGSVRALATGMITAIVARAGRPRWCETASAEPGAAETFLALFPGTRFLCLHRSCPDVVYAALHASPWGLSGPGFAGYTAAYPGNAVAALAAWWTGHTAPLLAFEDAHPRECLRVRYEDLVADPAAVEADIDKLVGLSAGYPAPQPPGDDPDAGPSGPDAVGCGAGFPAAQLPDPLLAQVNALHVRLGYPPLG